MISADAQHSLYIWKVKYYYIPYRKVSRLESRAGEILEQREISKKTALTTRSSRSSYRKDMIIELLTKHNDRAHKHT